MGVPVARAGFAAPIAGSGTVDLVEAIDGSARAEALRLRSRAFRGGLLPDGDPFDWACHHFLLLPRDGGPAIGGFRVQIFPSGAAAAQGYAAQFYDLAPLTAITRPVAELGRLWLESGQAAGTGVDGLRLVLAGLTRLVLQNRTALLFGCASFPDADGPAHAAALAWLRAHHAAPDHLGPRAYAPADVPHRPADGRGLPPLVRCYLAAGAWVGPDLVEDRDLGTAHVFMALETARVPPARGRVLKALARLSAR